MSFAGDHLVPLADKGLGNSAYLADGPDDWPAVTGKPLQEGS